MNTPLHQELVHAALVAKPAPAPAEVRAIFEQVASAETPAQLLECLLALTERRVPMTDTLEASVAAHLPPNRQELAAAIIAQILSKADPRTIRMLFENADDINSVTGLIRFLTKLTESGFPLTSLVFDDVLKPPEATAGSKKKTDAPEDKTGKVRSVKRGRRNGGTGVDGMHPPKAADRNGGYLNTPQKDIVRAAWGKRIADVSLDPARTKVFSLLGEKMEDLPIYTSRGIPENNVYAAEFDPDIFARMQPQRGDAHVFQGNCYDFDEQASPDIRFRIMNLDLCGPIGEFFRTHENRIFKRLATTADIAVTSRVRQDSIDLNSGFVTANELIGVLPEIKGFMKLLQKSKEDLFGNEQIRTNMVLREIYFLWRMIHSLHRFTRCESCERKVSRAYAVSSEIVRLSQGMSADNDEDWCEVFRRIEAAFHIKIKEPQSEADVSRLAAMSKKFLYQAAPLVQPARVNGGFNGMDSLFGDAEEEAGYAELDPNIRRRFARVLEAQRKIFLEKATRECVAQEISGIERTTYTHGNHTMQTWFMHISRCAPKTVLQSFVDVMRLLINAPETVIEGNMTVKEWRPPDQERKVKIPSIRVLDSHAMAFAEDLTVREISPDEKLRRRAAGKRERNARRRRRLRQG